MWKTTVSRTSNLGKRVCSLVAIGVLIITTSTSVWAAPTPNEIGRWKDWSAYSLTQEDGQKVCFVVSEPTEKLPRNVNHGNVFLIITHWVSKSIKGEPSIMTGYTFKEGSAVTAEVGGSKWEMFTHQQSAWIRDTKEEKNLIEAMKKGSDLRVKATSQRGTATEYKISLRGLTAALDKIDTGC